MPSKDGKTRTMWKKLLDKLTKQATFADPADPQAIHHAQTALELAIPTDLIELLTESNGVKGDYRLDLIWPIERIEADNLAFRRNPEFAQLYMPFDHLLFFADSGDGSQFAFPIQQNEIRKPDIFLWNHETDSRTWVAPNLQKYLEWSIKRKLPT